MGATIGVTVMGVIVNHGLPPGVGTEGTQIHRLPPARAQRVRGRAQAGVPRRRRSSRALVWVIAAVWVKEVSLRSSVDEIAAAEAAAGAPNPGGLD